MATAEQYAAWIVANKDKKGTPEFDTVAKAYQAAKSTVPVNTEQYNPTEGMSTFEKIAAGAGKAIVDTGRGVAQLFGADNQAAIDESRRLDAPLMDTGAGVAGNIAGNIGMMLAPGGVVKGVAAIPKIARALPSLSRIGGAMIAPKTVTGAAALGGGIGAVQPVATNESRIANVAVSSALGAGGQALGGVIGAIAKPTKAALKPTLGNVANRAQELGAILTPGEKTGSVPLRQLEAGLESFPPTATRFSAIRTHNQSLLNRTAAKAIGEDADTLSEGVLGSAYVKIGDKFNSVRNEVIHIDKSFIDDLAAIENKAGSIWGGRGDTKITSILSDAVDEAAKGPITGARYVELRSELAKMSRDAYSSQNSRLGHTLDSIVNSLDDAAQKSMSGDNAALLQEARGQWKTLKIIEKSLNGENVSGPKLANSLRKADPKGFTYGFKDNDLYDMARFADRFKSIVGDSGTATRLGVQMMASGAIGGTTAAVTGGDPTRGISYGLAAPIGANLLARGYLAKPVSNYFSSGLVSGQNYKRLSDLLRPAAISGPVSIGLANRGEQ